MCLEPGEMPGKAPRAHRGQWACLGRGPLGNGPHSAQDRRQGPSPAVSQLEEQRDFLWAPSPRWVSSGAPVRTSAWALLVRGHLSLREQHASAPTCSLGRKVEGLWTKEQGTGLGPADASLVTPEVCVHSLPRLLLITLGWAVGAVPRSSGSQGSLLWQTRLAPCPVDVGHGPLFAPSRAVASQGGGASGRAERSTAPGEARSGRDCSPAEATWKPRPGDSGKHIVLAAQWVSSAVMWLHQHRGAGSGSSGWREGRESPHVTVVCELPLPGPLGRADR